MSIGNKNYSKFSLVSCRFWLLTAQIMAIDNIGIAFSCSERISLDDTVYSWAKLFITATQIGLFASKTEMIINHVRLY